MMEMPGAAKERVATGSVINPLGDKVGSLKELTLSMAMNMQRVCCCTRHDVVGGTRSPPKAWWVNVERLGEGRGEPQHNKGLN